MKKTKRKLTKSINKARQDRFPKDNWIVRTYKFPTEQEDIDFIRKEYKIKDPIAFEILVPEKFLDTLGVLFYKIQKDLGIINIEDVEFYAERNKLPKVKKYLSDYYGSYIKDTMKRYKQNAKLSLEYNKKRKKVKK